MELTDAVRERRSTATMTEPAPSDRELADIVARAAHAPDHGRLRPWRLIIVRGNARHALGEAFAAAACGERARRHEYAASLRAPLLLTLVHVPDDNPKVPEWEQVAAVTAMVQNLALLLHERGWASMWRTGARSRAERVRELLGLTGGERLLGWLYIGTADGTSKKPPRTRPAIVRHLSRLRPDGTVEPIPCE